MLTLYLHPSLPPSLSFPFLYTQPGAPPTYEDPREALLKLDAAAKAEPMFFGAAYKDNKLASTTIEEELDDVARKKKAARRERA